MDKGRQFVYNPGIYPMNLRVVFGADAEFLNSAFVELDLEEIGAGGFDDDYEGRAALVGNRINNRKEVLIIFKDSSPIIKGLSCHECFHATFCYARCLGIYMEFMRNENTEEACAYLNQWINKCVDRSFSKMEEVVNEIEETEKE